MSNGYQIYDQNALYFLTFQIVDWVDVFTRRQNKDIIVDCFDFCIKNKGLKLYAYVIMTNHVHVIARAEIDFKLSDIIRDFKKFTANKLLPEVSDIRESRKEWMLKRFEIAAAQHSRNSHFQVWTHENHPVYLYSKSAIDQRIKYIHENPVRAGFVENAEEYLYSSARNYSGRNNKLEIEFV